MQDECLTRLKREFRELRRTVIGTPDHHDRGHSGRINELEVRVEGMERKLDKIALWVTTAAAIGSAGMTLIVQMLIHYL